MNDWSKDIDLEVIKDYLKECAENDDYHYEQYQVDIVMHEYIRQKQVIEAITSENERLHSIIKEVREYVEKRKDTQMFRKNDFKEAQTNIDIVLEQYEELEEILDKAGDEK